MNNLIQIGVRISREAKAKIERIAKKNFRSVAKEIESMIMDLKEDDS